MPRNLLVWMCVFYAGEAARVAGVKTFTLSRRASTSGSTCLDDARAFRASWWLQPDRTLQHRASAGRIFLELALTSGECWDAPL